MIVNEKLGVFVLLIEGEKGTSCYFVLWDIHENCFVVFENLYTKQLFDEL